MKTGTKRKTRSQTTFDEEYRSALGEYARRRGEAALGRAYDLGRRAITDKKSLMEIVSLHHQSLHAMLSDAQGASRHQELLTTAADFLAETLSPYEMAHRGVQDAIAALRQFNETLEEEIKRIAYAVHDEARPASGGRAPRARGRRTRIAGTSKTTGWTDRRIAQSGRKAVAAVFP